MFIIVILVIGVVALGVGKVVLDCQTGEDVTLVPAQNRAITWFFVSLLGNVRMPVCFTVLGKGLYRGCRECFRVCCSCLVKEAVSTVSGAVDVITGKPLDKDVDVGIEDRSDINIRRPATCDGMCRGAKRARRLFRKKMRLLKRKGRKPPENAIWWETKYECTCVVRCV